MTAALTLARAFGAISPKDVTDCVNGSSVEVKVAACTRLLQSHGLNNANIAAVYFDRANAYRDLGSADLAITDYGQAIRLRPDLAQAYNSRGALLLARRDVQHALADFDAAVRLKPDFGDALLNRGAARASRHDYQGAISDYDAVLNLRPNDLKAVLNRGIALGETRDYPRALTDFSAAIRLAPEASEGYSGRCWIRAASGIAPESAVGDCDRAVRLNPQDSAVIGYRALLALRLGDFDAAIVDYDRGLSTAPRNATLLFGRGIAKLRAGNPTGANEDLAAAKALDPRMAQTYAGYGIAP
jgi:lipoprotein NlpI